MNVFFSLKGSKHFLFLFCMEMQRRRYDELSLKTCTNYAWRKESGKKAMPEPVLINLVSDYDNSLTGYHEICLAMK